MSKIPITIAKGDGIGPEIMDAVLHILDAAGANLEYHEIEVGEKAYLQGFETGIDPKVWDTIRSTEAFLKAPITTPQGGGYKSLNVTIRTTLGLFANVRPCISYFPFIQTKHPGMDVVIVRENEEGLYSGIEYQQTPEMTQSLRLISRSGSEKIVRYAFEYAKRQGRKKVTCFAKDNIMKISDGLFRKVFDEVAAEYSDILNEFWIVDIGAAKLADSPELFDVIVMPNLYGDILSDVGAQISGSVGLVGSANIGEHGAMFEAIHGSAPKYAGKNIANPSALLLASILMLNHVGESGAASLIHNAWLKTIEEGTHTKDIYNEGSSRSQVGTKEFGEAVAKNLGKNPEKLDPVSYEKQESFKKITLREPTSKNRELVGCDVFIYAKPPLENFIDKIVKVNAGALHLTLVTNRGVKVWPEGQPETFCVDHFRLRFSTPDFKPASHDHILQILQDLNRMEIDVIKTENLYLFDKEPGFSGAKN